MDNNIGANNFGTSPACSHWYGAPTDGIGSAGCRQLRPTTASPVFHEQLSPWNGQWPPSFHNLHRFPPPPSFLQSHRPNYSYYQAPPSNHQSANAEHNGICILSSGENVYYRNGSEDPSSLQTFDNNNQWEKDQGWVNKFVRQQSCQQLLRKAKESLMNFPELKISESQEMVRKCLLCIEALKKVHNYLALNLDTDELSWNGYIDRATLIKLELENVLRQLTPEKLKSLKQKLKLKTKRRNFQRMRKQLTQQNTLEKRKKTELLHEKINAWQVSIKLKQLSADMEKTMKSEADSVLSEVRQKQSEATRTLELVKAIVKLRTIKIQSKSKDLHIPEHCNATFLSQSKSMEDVLTRCLTNYAEEEQALQVMLDEEHQETRENAQKNSEREHRVGTEKRRQKINDNIFGQDGIMETDPLFPYYEYYTRADRDFQTLIQVRRGWDRWSVPSDSPVGSGVPVGWIIPEQPSSEAWALHLAI